MTSGGTHLRVRVPCCWKWHSSRLQSSIPSILFNRRSFLKGRDAAWIALGHLGPGLAEPEAHLIEHPLALADANGNPIVALQMLGQQLSVPEILDVSEVPGIPAQISFKPHPLAFIQRSRPTWPFPISQPIESSFLEPLHPALNRSGILAKWRSSGSFGLTLFPCPRPS